MTENDTPPVAYLVTLHGGVQGMGLRKRLKKAAEQNGVKGWVRNRAAGHVQAHLEGPPAKVKGLMADLVSEKIRAELEGFVSTATDVLGYESFDIMHLGDRPLIQPSALKGAVRRIDLLEKEHREIARLITESSQEEAPEARKNLCDVATALPSRFLEEPLASRSTAADLPFKLVDVCGSFAAEIWAGSIVTREMKDNGIDTPGRILNEKRNGLDFTKSLGIRVPETFQHNVTPDELVLAPGRVVKPMKGAGAKGVFAIYTEDRILQVVDKKILGSIDEVHEAIRIFQGKNKTPRRWMSEEMILGEDENIANDVKVYCFYGQTPIALEVNRTGTSFKYCWWNDNLERTDTGKYLKKVLEGTRISSDYFEFARKISSCIPVPFMRVDFLKSATGPVFGEFTPKPGNFHDFDAAIDSWLGRCYAEARGRLMADLMKGKRFPEYEAFLASLKPSKPKKKRPPAA